MTEGGTYIPLHVAELSVRENWQIQCILQKTNKLVHTCRCLDKVRG